MSAAIPDHVPTHLVREFNFYTAPGMAPEAGNDPHLALKPLRDGPRVFYARENTRDKQGTWVPAERHAGSAQHAEDLFQPPEHPLQRRRRDLAIDPPRARPS